MFNIPKELTDYAEKFDNIDFIAAGGGCDYIYRMLTHKECIIAAIDDACSPDALDDPCLLMIFDCDEDPHWLKGVAIEFKSTKKAIKALSTMIDFKH